MSAGAKKPQVRDARLRHRAPQEWVPVRTGTLTHVEAGEGFVRPDLFAWLCNGKVVLERVAPADAPDEQLVLLFDEALAAYPGEARPTALRVATQELAELCAKHNARGLPIVVASSVQRLSEEALALGARGDDREEKRWPLLHGGKVSAEAVGALLRTQWELFATVPWTALLPWEIELELRAPSLGLEDASIRVDAQDRVVSLALTLADRDGQLEWRPGQRPTGTRWVEMLYTATAGEDDAIIREAEAQGWGDARWPERHAFFTAWDAESFPRPLTAVELGLWRLTMQALTAWFARPAARWPLDPDNRVRQQFVTDEGHAVTLSLRGLRLYRTDADSPDAWANTWLLPRTPPLEASAEYEPLLRALREAGTSAQPELEAQLLAAGPGAAPALLAALEDPATWVSEQKPSEWFGPWLLLALGRLGEPGSLSGLLRFAATHEKELSAFALEELPSVLAAFGPEALVPLSRVLAGVVLDPFLRAAAATALYLIALEHPPLRPLVTRIYAAFFAALDDAFDPRKELAHLMLDEAARMHDEAVDEAVLGALARKRFLKGVFELGDYEHDRRRPGWTRRATRTHAPVAEKLAAPWWTRPLDE